MGKAIAHFWQNQPPEVGINTFVYASMGSLLYRGAPLSDSPFGRTSYSRLASLPFCMISWDRLSAEGLLYSTVDEDHYKCIETEAY